MKGYHKNILCTNCGVKGHILRECSNPITSFGIIAYKIVEEHESTNSMEISKIINNIDVQQTNKWPKIELLMIQRKDTIGYTDFVRGKYPSNESLGVYFSEMTIGEQEKLIGCDFDTIWNTLWLNHNSKTYRNEYDFSKKRFEQHDLRKLVEMHPAQYTFQEFGFPKGRRNIRELDKTCAIREFAEETGYNPSDYILSDEYITEDFTGTDNVKYKHIYYLAHMNPGAAHPKFDKTNRFQMEEIKNIGFLNRQEILTLLRPYDIEKRKVVDTVFDILESRFLY